MKNFRRFFLVFSLILFLSGYQNFGRANTLDLVSFFNINESVFANNPPVAVNDSIIFLVNGTKTSITFNILENDYDPENDEFALSFIIAPTKGKMDIDEDGNFTYTAPDQFFGTVSTTYIICEIGSNEYCGEGKIIIQIKNDYDNDGVADDEDIDDDNDGILDIDESLTADSDGDGIPNYLDIDSDNDGIPDNIEAQPEKGYISPLWLDTDKDGWDDAYDLSNGGKYFELQDTDNDGTPDFLDSNSDDDSLNDILEATLDVITDSGLYGVDSDKDGLDDKFDIVLGWSDKSNPLGSNVTLPDSDDNGIRNWRDPQKNKPVDGDGSALQNDRLSFKVYPNPASDQFSIEILSEFSETAIKMEVVNTNGKIVYYSEIQNTIAGFSTGQIGKGIYFVRLISNSDIYSRKLIIQ